MSDINNLLLGSIKLPAKLLTRTSVIPEKIDQELNIDPKGPIVYILKTASASDLFAAQDACKKLGLPDPQSPLIIGTTTLPRALFLTQPTKVLFGQPGDTKAISVGQQMLALHEQHPDLNIQFVPINVTWGRAPGQETASVKEVIADQQSPNWLRKSLIVLTSGRLCMVRVSNGISLREMVERYGSDITSAHKLIRVARVHFYRQQLSATGPRQARRSQIFNSILASKAVKKAIADEAKSKKISTREAQQRARKLIDEIAADFSDTTIRLANRVLKWIWSKVYRDMEVLNADRVRELADKGHSIVYVPCHRSHMDYILLSYVIYNQGLVPPHIAAGINLNFWPVGSFFRRGGAFFIRRSFRGNKMYSAVFREYLGQLYSKGNSVEYFTEGGRSRTGRLLPPKTGMLGMTVQAILRGVDRPITLVPIYIGYEHVMEVSTYHKELKGKNKEKESMFSVFKMLGKLRNYGNGYVNFGEPITLNQRLNQEVPEWRDSIDPIETQKPSWLTPFCNRLGNDLMTNINQATALNGTTLISLILLSSEQHSLSLDELARQIDFSLDIQRTAPYHKDLYIPEQSGAALVEQTLELGKFQQSKDQFGNIISLDDKNAVEMTYYRNNILHSFVLQAMVSSVILARQSVSEEDIQETVKLVYPLLQAEWYLWPASTQLDEQIGQIIDALKQHAGVKLSRGKLKAPERTTDAFFQLQLFSRCINESLQRFSVINHMLKQHQPIRRADLEKFSTSMATRLAKKHGIDAPEFYDKKVLANLINTLKDMDYVSQDDDLLLNSTQTLDTMSSMLDALIAPDVLHTLGNTK